MIPFLNGRSVTQETPKNTLTVQVDVPTTTPLRFIETGKTDTYNDVLKTRLSDTDKDEICAACVALNVSLSHFVRSVALQVARAVNERNTK